MSLLEGFLNMLGGGGSIDNALASRSGAYRQATGRPTRARVAPNSRRVENGPGRPAPPTTGKQVVSTGIPLGGSFAPENMENARVLFDGQMTPWNSLDADTQAGWVPHFKKQAMVRGGLPQAGDQIDPYSLMNLLTTLGRSQ